MIDHYLNYADNLKKVYRHKSQWGKEFEYVCIERWFVLYEFMEEQGIDHCVLLDSDILVYSDLTEVESTFQTYKMTWTGFSAHINFINDKKYLKEYCDFVLEVFSKHDHYMKDDTISYPRIMRGELDGNISDMLFFHDYNIKKPGRLLNIAEPLNDGVFDITIEMDQGMEMENGFKKIEWKGKIPYGILKGIGNQVRLHTIHFWTKKVISSYFKYNNMKFLFIKFLFSLIMFNQKLIRRLQIK
jgi:hypothetical protein